MIAPVLFVTALAFSHISAAQEVYPAKPHSTGFNSSFTLTSSQIEAAQLDKTLADSIENVINFERTQLAFGGPAEDDFYTLPPLTNKTVLKPGQLLKVQPFTNQSGFAIPAATALSRILYTTTNFNGTVIPTSAFVLWPYTPAKFGSTGKETTKAPVVLWAHGTSGIFKPQSPSSHRALWYANSAPFTLAQARYAVVAPDFAGLGISTSWDGSHIPHQYSASPTTAHDSLYGLRAALEAFPDRLDINFVAMGHSQGGGAAWAIAEALANEAGEFADLNTGYRGSIAASPTTQVWSGPPAFMITTVAVMLDSIFPSFKLEDWLTPLGVARTKLLKEIQGGIPTLEQTHMTSDGIVRADFNASWYAEAFNKIADAGRKNFKGPLLVLQGTDDPFVPYNTTSKTVEDTSKLYPDNDLEFLVASGVGHVPDMEATRHLWLRWIEDRFEGKPVPKGSVRTDVKGMLPIEQYLSISNSLTLWAGLPQFGYEVPF